MAGQVSRTPQSRTPYLSLDQQNLLAAALNSQSGNNNDSASGSSIERPRAASEHSQSQPTDSYHNASMNDTDNSALFMSPSQADLDGFNADFTPDVDYLDGDSFDFDNADLGGEMIGALPGDGHEKRKGSDDIKEGDAKRQETQEGEKNPKKPGRKPLTSEPTTKRKAQNRAAQRAFRERKEAHLKDLETKVTELTKADEENKHENGVLKAQVERLKVELQQYRKRLSLNSSTGRVSPTQNSYSSVGNRSNSNSSAVGSNNFSFDFPKFGTLPGSQILGNANGNISNSPVEDTIRRTSMSPSSSTSPSANVNSIMSSQSGVDRQRVGSTGRSLSPQSMPNAASTTASTSDSPSQLTGLDDAFTMYSSQNNMHGFANTLPQMKNDGADPFGDLFSPSILKSAGIDASGQYFGNNANNVNASNVAQDTTGAYGGDNNFGISRVFQFNGGASSGDSTSPSASSSNWNQNANSSCETSPEPSHGSPGTKDKTLESFAAVANASNTTQQAQKPTTSNLNNNFFGFASDYNVPSADNFDPVLFGDYRDSNEAIVGASDFSGGFFDDALNQGSSSFDMASPSNLFGILQSPSAPSNASLPAAQTSSSTATAPPKPSQSLMADMDKARDGFDDDYGLTNNSMQTVQPATAPAAAIANAAAAAAPSTGKLDANGKMISCNNIWNQLQANPDFQDGKFDLEGLCSELRAKARCSESGVLVDQDHVDAALRRLGKKDDQGNWSDPSKVGMGKLMFEREGWDNVVRKMDAAQQQQKKSSV